MKKIKELLGGYNCGGCGYEDCAECAMAIKKGEAPADICPMIDEDNIEKIEQILNEKEN